MRFYAQFRYDLQQERHFITKTKKLADLKEIKLEDEYEDYKKNVDINNWKNIRGPRPWETDDLAYKELIERRAKESKDGWVFRK